MRVLFIIIALTNLVFAKESQMLRIINNIELVKEADKNKAIDHVSYYSNPFEKTNEIMGTMKKKEVKKEEIEVKRKQFIANNIKLGAIMGKRAFINNKWFSVGEEYKTVKLEEILEDSVIIFQNGFTQEVFLIKQKKKDFLNEKTNW